ncbi:MAG TPA: hypothetical protein VMB05_02135 [Solirubrobacteraceae bacterium]|nr:hypothetical protein [Solirubrobacteraceae bacterium]
MVTSLVVLLAVLAFCASAGALIHRGHVFTGSLETLGGSKLSSPSDVAVNERTDNGGAGDTYILDKANNRVIRLGPNHEFLEAWGAGVLNGGEGYEQCTEEASCKPGIAGFGSASSPKFDEPVAIAVDNSPGGPKGSASSGDVYVVANRSWKKATIYKFSFDGKPLGRLIDRLEEKEEPWPVMGVAVDRKGVVWVDREGEEEEVVIERFTSEAKNKLIDEPEEFELPEVAPSRPARPGLAVDSLGHVYVAYEPEGATIEEEEELFEERAEERHEKKELPVEEHLQAPCVVHICLVAQLAVSVAEDGGLSGEVTIPEVAPETNSTGVAVDPSLGNQSSNDVYIDNGTSVSAFTSEGKLIQTFGQAQLAGGAGLRVNGATNEVLVADSANARVDVYGPEPAGPPVIQPGSLSTSSITSFSAKLKATIDPTGLETRYFMRYGTSPCAGEPSACGSTTPLVNLGGGFGDQPAPAELSELAPGATYHFVVVAENALGKAQSSEEGVFTTFSSGELESVLADGRAWELVSPANKRGAAVEPLAHEGGLIQAAADGRGLAYTAAAPIGDESPPGQRAPELTQLVGTRESPGKWSMHNVTTPNEAAQGIVANSRREYQFFSSDLSHAVVYPIEPLAPSQTFGETSGFTAYERDTSCRGLHCYTPLLQGVGNRSSISFQGATPDQNHVLIARSVGAGKDLLEWSREGTSPGEGQLLTVNILPNGNEASDGQVGFGGAIEGNLFSGAQRVISLDGSRVSWSQVAEAGGSNRHLYQTELKDDGTLATDQVDEANEDAPTPTVPAQAVYMTASVNGDRVFFTDNQRLTSNASAEREETGDLYVFERDKPAGERLTDLSPDLNAGESSAVQGGVLGASEDGSYIYFVANGVLAEGASPGKCVWQGVPSAKCNLYVVHNSGSGWEKPRLIGRLSNEDGPDWGVVSTNRAEFKVVETTARVSPNGRYLAFMSTQRLTGYNNLDANSGQPDEEVFQFDAQGAGTGLTCVSCNPGGAQPVGVHDVQESGEGRGLLVDRLGIWSTESEDSFAHWLAGSVPGWTNLDDRESVYQSRYLSNSGRMFFNSSDSLVKQDVNHGKADVYEYEPLGVGSCAQANAAGGCVSLVSSGESQHETAFLDASEDGSDVFFLTDARLVPGNDPDNAYDIYDARVCESAAEGCPPPPTPPPTPCTDEGCRPAPNAQPGFAAPASSSPSGAGNAVQQSVLGKTESQKPKAKTRAQLLAAALKACKKKHKAGKKRTSCEKQARKKYGAKKPAKKSAAKRATGGKK